MPQRDETSHRVAFEDERCSVVLERLRPGVVLTTITGYDQGSFGPGPLEALSAELARHTPAELYVDTAGARGATWAVSQEWTSWFRTHREHLTNVHILVRSKYLHLTISVSKELSRTGDMIRIYSDPERFDEAIRRRVPSWASPVRDLPPA